MISKKIFYPRIILPKLKKELKTPHAIVITGMRQVGKTTLLKHFFNLVNSNNKAFFDFENPIHRKVFEEENFDNIWQNLIQYNIDPKKRAYLFIDEIQHLPKIS